MPDTKEPGMKSKLSDDAEHFIRFVTINNVPKHIPIQTLIDKARNNAGSTVVKDSTLKNKWGSTNLKLASAIFYDIFIFSPNDCPSKTLKNVFYFIEKALFVLEIFRFS